MISNQFKKWSFIILQIKDKKVPMGKILLEYHLLSVTNFQFSYPGSKDLIINSPINFLVLNRIDPSLLWKPDLFLYNSASESFDATFPVNMVVSSNGRISQIPPGIFKSTCLVSFFPWCFTPLFQVLIFFQTTSNFFIWQSQGQFIITAFFIERNNITVAGNHECKKTDCIESVQSYLKTHSFVVTLYD